MPRVQDIDMSAYHGIKLIIIDPFAWIEPVAHLSERQVCARVKWISVTSPSLCRVFNPHSGTFGKYSDKFGFRKYWLLSLHVTSRLSCRVFNPHFEHSVNIGTNSAFGKIRPSDNFRLRITSAFGHTLFFNVWIKFDFFIIFWWRHVLTITFVIMRYTKNFSKYPYQHSVDCNTCRNDVACSLERRWIAEGTRHRPERQNS